MGSRLYRLPKLNIPSKCRRLTARKTASGRRPKPLQCAPCGPKLNLHEPLEVRNDPGSDKISPSYTRVSELGEGGVVRSAPDSTTLNIGNPTRGTPNFPLPRPPPPPPQILHPEPYEGQVMRVRVSLSSFEVCSNSIAFEDVVVAAGRPGKKKKR